MKLCVLDANEDIELLVNDLKYVLVHVSWGHQQSEWSSYGVGYDEVGFQHCTIALRGQKIERNHNPFKLELWAVASERQGKLRLRGVVWLLAVIDESIS